MTTSTELELRTENGHVSREWVDVMKPAIVLAEHVAGTDFVPRGLRGNAPAIVAAIMYGDELGLGPMQALAKISVIDGKPTLSAEAQRALILAEGHEIWVEEASSTKVTMSGRRAGSERTSSITWTLDDAKRAGLAGKPNWRGYPRQMLTARASADLARILFADVIGGLAATEELADLDEFDTAPLPSGAAPESGSTKRKRASRRRTTPALEAGESGQTDSGNVNPPDAPELPPLPDEPAQPLVEPDTAATPAESPAEEPLTIGEDAREVADSTAGEEPSEAETTSVAASSDQPADSPAENSSDNATAAQKKALDALVGRLRESVVEAETGPGEAYTVPVLSTEQLWAAAARRRMVDVDTMIELLGGRDEAGVLHWSPLRESLTKGEASDLIASLTDRARHWGVE